MLQGAAIKPYGAGTGLVPSLLVRQVLLEGLVELAGDVPRMDQLFGRVDDLAGNTAEEWRVDMRAAVEAMATQGRGNGGVTVAVGYPQNAAVLPYLSIILESGSEDQAGAVVGDVLAVSSEVIGVPSDTDETAQKVVSDRHEGTGWSSTVQIGSWTRAGETSEMLNSVAREILFRDKGRLAVSGVHEVTFSEAGFQPDQDLYPDTGFVPVLRCTLSWTFRTTRRSGPVVTRINAPRATFGN